MTDRERVNRLIEAGDVEELTAMLDREDERRARTPHSDPTEHQRLNFAITLARHKREAGAQVEHLHRPEGHGECPVAGCDWTTSQEEPLGQR